MEPPEFFRYPCRADAWKIHSTGRMKLQIESTGAPISRFWISSTRNLSSLVPKHHNCCNAVTTLTDKVITDEHTKLEIILIHGEVYIVHGPIYIVDRPKVPQQNSEDF